MRAPGLACAASHVGRRLLGDVAALPQRRIGLRGELQHVAAIGEHRRAVGQHHREAGAAGEAGQPGQPLGGGGDVFAQMLVRARHDEAFQFLPDQFRAQLRTIP